MMKASIKEIWSEQESVSSKQVLKDRVDSIINLNCYIGLIGVTGAKMFQLELDKSVIVNKSYLRKFRGLEIQAIPVSETTQVFTIILLEKNISDIFILFIEDIIENLVSIGDTKEALALINQRVNYWRTLFARITGELLSPEKQRGLFGELFFLRQILNSSDNKNEALASWRGANSANQDFTRNRNAVEIKTTKASKLSVHISNEQQLDFNQWDSLFLGLLVVSESSGNQNSLCSIINEIKDLLSYEDASIQEFENKLEAAGVTAGMIEYYDEISYSVSSRRFFRIQEGFPMIIRETLNNDSIYNVKYQINISSCNSFEAPEQEVLSSII